MENTKIDRGESLVNNVFYYITNEQTEKKAFHSLTIIPKTYSFM